MNKYFFALSFVFTAQFILAQSQVNTKAFSINKRSTITVRDIKQDFAPDLMNIEKPVPGGIPKTPKIYEPKKTRSQTRSLLTPQNESLADPGLGINFSGNTFSGSTPCDNDIAVSSDSTVLSAVNTTLYFYDADSSAAVLLGTTSFAAFTASLGLPHQEFDPKVLYDPNEDKYIVVVLNGYTDTTSSIIVGFSQTNDLMGAWNLYSIPGNPLNNGLWTDYPIIAMTNNELFITVNLLYPDSTWQAGFNESIIWQINKFNGYNNAALNANLITGIQYNGKNIRNLCPVKGGSQLYGPDMYFLSNRNFETQGDTFFLVHVLDTAGAAGFGVTVQMLNSNADYFMAGDARQSGSHKLATNDSRVLGAFIENDKIQFVHNSMDTTTTFCGVYHGIISNVSTSPTVQGQQISDTLRDIGYPNISYAGLNATDNSSIITFDHTAPTVSAGVSAIKSDGSFNYSYIKKIKDGTSYVNILGSLQERWGDYSGSQRMYGNPGEVWMSGYQGYLTGINRYHRAYIAQLSFIDAFLGNNDVSEEPIINAVVFPNPMENIISVDFELAKAEYLEFDLVDLTGRRVQLLMREYVKAGKNRFTFSIADLASGTYVFNIKGKDRFVNTTKVVRQ
jgi:hypothetical protein